MKLRSGDVSWYDLTALTFHFATPPLPTRLASWAYALPVWFHCAACAGMFTYELLIPFFLFAPLTCRHRAAFLTSPFVT